MTPEARDAARVAIVGGGYSGAAVAAQLAHAAGGRVAITIVEPRAELGRGIAYSTADPDHRLNGPLDNHLLDPGRPDQLRQWCRREGVLERDPEARAANGGIYLRRGAFGAYVADAIAELRSAACAIRHHRATATGLRGAARGIEVVCAGQAPVVADLVVVATGNGSSRLPGAFAPLCGHPALLEDPFEEQALRSIGRTARVLLVGSGLTALDVVSTLLRRGHAGPIRSLSRHGVRPRSHRARVEEASAVPLLGSIEGEVPAYVESALAAGGVRALSRALRQRICGAAEWQVPFDGLRNVVWQVWPRLALVEKRRFLRHLRTWYDAHRFRAPPQNEALAMDGVQRGQLAFHAGRFRRARAASDGAIEVRWCDAATGEDAAHEFDAVVNCSGLDPACGADTNPFLASLLDKRLIRPDPTGLGFAVDAQCRPLSRAGPASPLLRIVGPPTAGTFGDPLGVIFIAQQIRRLLPAMLVQLGIAG